MVFPRALRTLEGVRRALFCYNIGGEAGKVMGIG